MNAIISVKGLQHVATLLLLGFVLPARAFEPIPQYFEFNVTEGFNPFWPDYYSVQAAAAKTDPEYHTFRWGNAKTKLDEAGAIGFMFINEIPTSKPAMLGSGLSYALTSLPPCSVDAFHLHPHSVEHMFTIKGAVTYSFVSIDGAYHESTGCADSTTQPGCAVKGQCPKCQENSYFDTIIVPEGVLQWQTNLGCETAQFMSVFNAPQPGRVNFNLPFAGGIPDFHVRGYLGLTNRDYEKIKGDASKLGGFHYFPHALLAACRKACGIRP